MTSDILWGIRNFIWDSMDYYPEGNAIPVITRWIDRYLQDSPSWPPQGGDGGLTCIVWTLTDVVSEN